MTFARSLFLALWIAASSVRALAANLCDDVGTPRELAQNLQDEAARRAPVKYHEMASNIQIVTTRTGDTVIPFATEQLGIKVIVFPPTFTSIVCKVAMAEYAMNGGSSRAAFDRAAGTAGRCFDSGKGQKACLSGFADEVGAQYMPVVVSQGGQNTATGIYRAALNQILMHEYAHHLLNHFSRMKAHTLARIDAEFEADLFAILNGVQSAEPVSAMYYFFDGLAAIEQHTQALTTNEYESGVCRAGNVENITGFVGAVPITLVDAAYGGKLYLAHASPELFRSFGSKQFSGAAPQLSRNSCSRITKVALDTAYSELKQVYLRFELETDMLFAPTRAVDTPRVARLLDDVSRLSAHFQYMNGIAAKSMAMLVRHWGLDGQRLVPLSPQIDRLLNVDAVYGDFESDDYGRLLQAQALALLQERKDLPEQARFERSYPLFKKGLLYNPAQSESWVNLAFIEFKAGNCTAAAQDFSAASATASEDDKRKDLGQMAAQVKTWTPEQCKVRAASFHPYP